MRGVWHVGLAVWQLAGAVQPLQPVFRSAVQVVRLDVSVTRDRVPLQGLTGRDFVVLDNGVEQDVQSTLLETQPLNVLLALDTSGSVSGSRLRHLVSAGDSLLSSLGPSDRVGLLTFSHKLHLLAPLTADVTGVRASLGRTVAEGGTALRDAAQAAIGLAAVDRTRSLVILFTDGADTASWTSEETAIEVARRAGVVVHVLTVGKGSTESSKRYGERTSLFVGQVAQVTGGRVWTASSERDLKTLVAEAFSEMRSRYLLTYEPKEATPGWHELKVRLRRGRADIKARAGYFVGS